MDWLREFTDHIAQAVAAKLSPKFEAAVAKMEAAVLKVDVSALSGAPTEVRLTKVSYCVNGMVATLLWDATADVTLMDLAGYGHFCFEDFAGIPNNAGAGVTGDILLTTTGATAGDSYSIALWLTKHYG